MRGQTDRAKRGALAALGLLACVAVAGCNLFGAPPTPTRAVDANSVEGALLAYATGSAPDADAAAASFGVIHVWDWGGDQLAAFSFAGGYGEAWSLCNGLARVTPSGGGWEVAAAGSRCWDSSETAEGVSGLYTILPGPDGAAQTVIFGDVLSPDVTAVSIEFAVGGENAVAEMGDGGYWLLAPGAPARAVAIDALGNLVQLFTFGEALALAPVSPGS
ncbi:MAG: hypothetical protein Kow00120_04140 [Anaerolineae bacterium]